MPTVPTFIESGVSGFVVSHWSGVLASGGTPPAVVKQLHAAIAQALTQPDVKERFAALALDTSTLGPDEYKKLIEDDVKRWKEVVVKSGIKLD